LKSKYRKKFDNNKRGNPLYKLDFFGVPVNNFASFKLDGKEKFGSTFGFCATLITFILMCLFIAVQVNKYVTQPDPHISETVEVGAFNEAAQNFSLGNSTKYPEGQPIAFQVFDFYKEKPIEDPALAEWEAYIVVSDGSVRSEIRTIIGTHPCTEDDWKLYHEPEASQKSRIERFKTQSPACLDRKDKNGNFHNLDIYGEN